MAGAARAPCAVLAPYTVMGAGLPLVFAVTSVRAYRRELRALNAPG
ncbi:hypothetical protein [Streptomyces sp. B8F3]